MVYAVPIEWKWLSIILLISERFRDTRGSVLYLLISVARIARLIVFLKVSVIMYSHYIATVRNEQDDKKEDIKELQMAYLNLCNDN